MQYSKERREAVLKKLFPPNNRPICEVAEEEGISAATLYLWRKQARDDGQLLPESGADPEGWSSRDNFNAVLETAALSEAEPVAILAEGPVFIEAKHLPGEHSMQMLSGVPLGATPYPRVLCRALHQAFAGPGH